MPYVPINSDVFVAAFTGGLGGMAVGAGWITNPNPASYTDVCKTVGAYAQAIDIAWNDPTLISGLEYDKIQCVSESIFVARGTQPASNTQFQLAANWAAVAAGVVALVQQADAYLAGQGILPSGGNAIRRARGIVIAPLPVDLTQFDLTAAGVNDGIVYALGDTILAIGETQSPARVRSGPWVVSAVNIDGIHGTLTRPTWWAHGAILETDGVPIEVGSEGITFSNTRWKAMGPQARGVVNGSTIADSFIVDTDDPGLYPEMMTMQIPLSKGTTGTLNFPILSMATGISVIDLSVRPATTTFYQVSTLTAGDIGAGGGFEISAITAAGTADATNSGTINVTINNQSLVYTS